MPYVNSLYLFSAMYSFLKMKICKDGAVLAIAFVISLYPSIPHEAGLKILRKRLNEPVASKRPTDDIIQMPEYVLKFLFFF